MQQHDSGINDQLEAEGIPDHEDALTVDEGIIPPRDHPQAVEEFGTTAAEQLIGESLADRVRREEPEQGDWSAAGGGLGRLVEPGSGVDEIDEEKDLVATAVAGDDGGLSAEEAAMHLVEED